MMICKHNYDMQTVTVPEHQARPGCIVTPNALDLSCTYLAHRELESALIIIIIIIVNACICQMLSTMFQRLNL